MMQATVSQVSQGIYEYIPTEDVVGYLLRERSMLAWAIDGASSLTAAPFMTYEDITDAGWFARRLGQLLEKQFQDVPFSKAQLHHGLQILRAEYRHDGGDAQPIWAWPVAAATVVEIDRTTEQAHISIYRYADCFVEVFQGTPPSVNHSARPAQLPSIYDVWKPYSGFQGHKLVDLRQRRMQQQKGECSTALTLNPASAMNAVEEQRGIATPAHIVLGSDGLSRVWDTYQLMTNEQAMDLIVQQGLPSLLQVLRYFEAIALTGSADLKRRDDASGIHIFLA
ncbi:hypothetical protein [Cupriavidus sp. IDO]|uniref:hypothetical protein n=1 Tax=Cupriavidus sp. IDO TaxID=1539142 RepID=UPI000689C559|nr:hypothetical protein [Cupriavidus sp. IDO]KWR77252.1 hypothetical protein RM96_31955 [Cupriavidus sp. IDO]